MKRAWKTIYCDPDHEEDVDAYLDLMMIHLTRSHKEWEFDMDQSWDAVREEEEEDR